MKRDHPEVFVRIRPSLTTSELKHQANTITLPSSVYDKKEKTYEYTKVFCSKTNNQEVWEEGIQKQLEVLNEGRSLTLLAYGVTGSGKTHTIFGNQQEQGIAFMLFQKLISKQREWKFAFSFIEIYNENLVDLLSEDGEKLILLEQKGKTVIPNIIERSVGSYQQLLDLIVEGTIRRTQSPTLMNESSSRSHAILQLSITNPTTEAKSKITIIDLAGSEKTLYSQTSKQVLEGSNINKSLLALGNCLNILSDTNRRNGYIPYRDSKITRILKDSLSGNARLIMIACISQNKTQIEQTLNTLNYASRASKIKWMKKQNKEKDCKQTERGCTCGYKEKWEESQKRIKHLERRIENIVKQLKKLDISLLENRCEEVFIPEQSKQNRRIQDSSDIERTKKQIIQTLHSFKQIEKILVKLNMNSNPAESQIPEQCVKLFDHKSSIFSKRTSSESYQQDPTQIATQRMRRDFDEGNRIVLRRKALAPLY